MANKPVSPGHPDRHNPQPMRRFAECGMTPANGADRAQPHDQRKVSLLVSSSICVNDASEHTPPSKVVQPAVQRLCDMA
eukprot:5099117-Pleurochrysis_carterae.AAC.3